MEGLQIDVPLIHYDIVGRINTVFKDDEIPTSFIVHLCHIFLDKFIMLNNFFLWDLKTIYMYILSVKTFSFY